MEMLTTGKSNNDGIIKAHMGSTDSSIEFWNCGCKNRIKSKCPNVTHRCGVCKKTGHLEKHCFVKKGTKVKERTVTTNFGKVQSFSGEKRNKTLRREAMVKKAKAHVTEAEEEDHDEEDEAYYVEDEEDEDIDGDLFEEECDGYIMSFERASRERK
jgi:hypothetical protein